MRTKILVPLVEIFVKVIPVGIDSSKTITDSQRVNKMEHIKDRKCIIFQESQRKLLYQVIHPWTPLGFAQEFHADTGFSVPKLELSATGKALISDTSDNRA